MIIFLYGEDSFRSHAKLKEIITEYEKKNPASLNLTSFSFKEDSVKDFENALETFSLFQQKKLIILRDIFALDKNNQKKIAQIFQATKLAKDNDNIVVIIEQGNPDKRLGLFKYLKKISKSQSFAFLNKAKARQWLRNLKDNYYPDLKIKNSMLNWLADKIAPNLWKLQNELQKIYFYQKGSQKETLTHKDLENLIVFPSKNNIFDTLDAIAKRNKKQALNKLASHFQAFEPELKILAMFQYQFRNLLRIKDLAEKGNNYSAIQKKIKLHPYSFRKLYYLSANFTLDELKKIYQRLFELDIGFKTGAIQDKKTALEMFVIRLS
jgi:DNA polymerase III delta subunit